MGIFDKLFGKKIKIKEATSKKSIKLKMVNRVEICFNSSSPPYSEPDVVTDLINYSGLADSFTPDVDIGTSYGHVPGVAEYLSSGEMPDKLTTVVLARAMMIGMIHDAKEMEKITVNAFKVSDTLGILIIKEI